MKVLGIRNAPQKLRYAVMNWDGQRATLVNSSLENMLVLPASITSLKDQIFWLYQELERVLRHHSIIDKIAIKPNEYRPGRESAASRSAAYFDAIVFLIAGKYNIPIESKLYRQIGTNRGEVREFAELNVGRTDTYWDDQMADAIAIAWAVKE